MDKLERKVALITGGSAGMGLAAAKLCVFANAGVAEFAPLGRISRPSNPRRVR
jgi:NAD(P)-dependent dehydrogenase (short-subunit alcohol dehydrogenase family)